MTKIKSITSAAHTESDQCEKQSPLKKKTRAFLRKINPFEVALALHQLLGYLPLRWLWL